MMQRLFSARLLVVVWGAVDEASEEASVTVVRTGGNEGRSDRDPWEHSDHCYKRSLTMKLSHGQIVTRAVLPSKGETSAGLRPNKL